MNIQILADSASDLSNSWYEKLNVEVVPVHVNVDGTDYIDGQTITPKEMYNAMREGKGITTSQPSPQAFKPAFRNCAETNEPLIYFSLSASLSGTHNSAKIMERQVKQEYPNAPIYIVDTKCVSLGYGLVIIRAARLANKGASLEEIIDIGTYHGDHMEHIFTVDNLEYLYRSGRLSRTTSFLGSLLKIKPILHLKKGKIALFENMRGSKKSLNRMVAIAEERGVNFKNQIIGICHGDNLSSAKKLASICREKLGAKNIIFEMIGSGVGTHAGPGALALLFLNKPYK